MRRLTNWAEKLLDSSQWMRSQHQQEGRSLCDVAKMMLVREDGDEDRAAQVIERWGWSSQQQLRSASATKYILAIAVECANVWSSRQVTGQVSWLVFLADAPARTDVFSDWLNDCRVGRSFSSSATLFLPGPPLHDGAQAA